jgi:hypothetical protein
MSRARDVSDSSLRLAATGGTPEILPAVLFVVLAGVPGCHAASIALLRDGAPLTVAASHLPLRRLTGLQYEQAAGPCWEATVADCPVMVDDIDDIDDGDDGDDGDDHGGGNDGGSWLGIARASGFTAALAIPLPTDDASAAVLQICTRAPSGWPAGARAAATFLAGYVGQHLPSAPPPCVIQP